MLRKALTHQGASQQTLSLGWEVLLAKTRESLRRPVPKKTSPVTLWIAVWRPEIFYMVLEMIYIAKFIWRNCYIYQYMIKTYLHGKVTC